MAGFLISMTLLSLGVILSVTGLVHDGPDLFTSLGSTSSALGCLVTVVAMKRRED